MQRPGSIGFDLLFGALAVGGLGGAWRLGSDPDSPLRSIAQTLLREDADRHDSTLDRGSLAQLSNTALIDAVRSGGTKSGYTFSWTSPTPPDPLAVTLGLAPRPRYDLPWTTGDGAGRGYADPSGIVYPATVGGR